MVNTGAIGLNTAIAVVSQEISTVITLDWLAFSPIQRKKRYPGSGMASSLTSVLLSKLYSFGKEVTSSSLTFTVPPPVLTFTVSIYGGADQPASTGLEVANMANDDNNKANNKYVKLLNRKLFVMYSP